MGGNLKRTILLVDDDTSLLITLSDFLKFEGYDVVTADSGEDGLAKLGTLTPDLIILDMSMPGMGGMGFLKAILTRSGRPPYPVLVLTARAHMAEALAQIAVDGFVAKPCDPNDLLAEVNRIVFLTGGRKTAGAAGGGAPRRKVLLGEDDEQVRHDLVAALAGAGFAVEGARNGPELLERAVQDRPDVVVMNVVLGSMNGDAVAGMLNAMPKTSGIPVVLYEAGASGIPAGRYADAQGNVRKLVRGNGVEAIKAAIGEVAG